MVLGKTPAVQQQHKDTLDQCHQQENKEIRHKTGKQVYRTKLKNRSMVKGIDIVHLAQEKGKYKNREEVKGQGENPYKSQQTKEFGCK